RGGMVADMQNGGAASAGASASAGAARRRTGARWVLAGGLFLCAHNVCAGNGVVSPWQVLPIYGGGYIQNVIIAPSKTNVWYNYVDVGGPYRSDDAGRHWVPLHANFSLEDRRLQADHVRGLSVDPRDENNLILAGGNNFDRPAGLYVSRNGGKSFERKQTARFYGNGSVRMHGLVIARNPFNPDEVIAGEDWDGLFRSTDNGETWQEVGPKEHWFSDIKYDQDITGRVYACSHDWTLPKDDPKMAAHLKRRLGGHPYRKYGFWRSEDSGRTWQQISEVSPNEIVQLKGEPRLVGDFGLLGNGHVKASNDGGATWEDFHQGLPPRNPENRNFLREDQFYAFAVAHNSRCYLTGNACGDLYVRRPGDQAWRARQKLALVLDGRQYTGHLAPLEKSKRFDALGSLVVDANNERHWLATDWFFIWESFDAGATWTTRVHGMMQLVSFTLEFDPWDENGIYYGVADMGYFYSKDGGRSYVRPAGCPYAHTIGVSRKTPGFLMATGGKDSTVIRRSFDGGVSWAPSPRAGLPPLLAGGHGAFGIAIDPTTDDVLLACGGVAEPGGGGVYRSRDRGETWEHFSRGLPYGIELFLNAEWGMAKAFCFGADGSCVLECIKNDETYYLDRSDGIWKRSNVNWRWTTTVADFHRAGRFLRSGKTVMESLDGGKSFHPLAGTPSCSAIAIDQHIPGLVVVADREAVRLSCDGGKTFHELSRGLDFPTGDTRRFYLDRGRLFGFTSGSGVWTRRLTEQD
ncbi:MAG: hypothetical protein ACI4RD_00960, partial [Kiritimatiellia bacterium]